MNQFIAKTFYKKSVVKVYLATSDGRFKLFYAIPKDKTVTIGDMTFVLNKSNRMISGKGIPTYICNFANSEPLNVLTDQVTVLTPEDYRVAIESHVAREIFDASNQKIDLAMVAVVLSGISLIATLALIYIFKQDFASLVEKINQIIEYFNMLGL